ncbi:novel immune-type receptor 5 isoform X2 [Megalobrama amblycephala]|uniref:novel immune-type receptor 5 isoform X2 n=1 Tax=Megalobrama amblycephala TaxID=75352 RepID=UPI002014553A|nr:novel immune-type receptor 5 isoform X2 [Megalobrama amblycephala]
MGKQLCVMIFLLYEAFTIHGDIKQQDSVLSVHEGDTVILSCSISTKQISVVSWYKQVTGEEPRLIASSLLQSSESQFHNGFDRNHFEVLRETDNFNLKIVNTVQSDSGTYYCAVSFSNIIEFGNGTLLVIKGSEASRPTHLQPPKFELVESEVNVPLQCSIQNQLESGRGEHRLYWFRHGSGESPSGSIYIHGNTSDSCVKSSEAGCLSPTCVFNLPKKTFSSSEKGTYFCALATCGEALFGNISNLNPGHGFLMDNFKSQNTHLIFVIGLTVLLTSNITINILLCCMRRKESTESKYHQIQTTDDDVSIIQYKEVNF